jgi:hypothetical protein
MEAVQELGGILGSLSSPQFQKMAPFTGDALLTLGDLLSDANYRIQSIAMQMLVLVVKNIGYFVQEHMHLILPALQEKLGDKKVSTRQQVTSVWCALGSQIDPFPLLQELFPSLDSSNWNARDESLKVVMSILLTAVNKGTLSISRENDAIMGTFIQRIAHLLLDLNARVRNSAIECLAVVDHVCRTFGTQSQVMGLVPDALPSSSDAVQTLKVLHTRLLQSDDYLPTIREDGVVMMMNEPPPTPMNSTPSGGDVGGFWNTPTDGNDFDGGGYRNGIGGSRSGMRRFPSASKNSRRIPWDMPANKPVEREVKWDDFQPSEGGGVKVYVGQAREFENDFKAGPVHSPMPMHREKVYSQNNDNGYEMFGSVETPQKIQVYPSSPGGGDGGSGGGSGLQTPPKPTYQFNAMGPTSNDLGGGGSSVRTPSTSTRAPEWLGGKRQQPQAPPLQQQQQQHFEDHNRSSLWLPTNKGFHSGSASSVEQIVKANGGGGNANGGSATISALSSAALPRPSTEYLSVLD